MNLIPATIAVAFDGKRFFDEKECTAYEAQHWHRLLEGLTAEQVTRALARDDVERADAIERAATAIAKKRLASGVRRRKRKNGGATDAPADDQGAEETGE